MVLISSFRGTTFKNDGKVGDYLCPPFDVIDDGLRSELYSHSELNIVRLENGKSYQDDDESENKYKRAATYYNSWLQKGYLHKSETPYVYILEEIFNFRREGRLSRKSLISLVGLKLNDVLPHEKTRSAPKEDRLKLVVETGAIFSSIMTLVEDRERKFEELLDENSQGEPIISGSIPSMHDFKLWKIKDGEKFFEMFSTKNLYIADGHHRWETAKKYAKEYGDYSASPINPCSLRMMNIFPMDSVGVKLLGYHRALSNLDESLNALLERSLEDKFDFNRTEWTDNYYNWDTVSEEKILYSTKKDLDIAWFILSPKHNATSTYELLDESFKECFRENFDNYVQYEHDHRSMIEKLSQDEFQACFFMNALSKDYFTSTVSRGKLLPPKSTFFYPKLPTGVLIQNACER